MKKRWILAILAIGMLSAMFITANAMEPRVTTVSPTLTFSGTTANCSVVVISPGDEIEVVMEIWRNDVLLSRWTGEGTGRVQVNGSRQVLKGSTYRLTANGTINGEPFEEIEVENTCW